MSTVSSPEQSINASAPIDVTFAGIVSVFMLSFQVKAFCPISKDVGPERVSVFMRRFINAYCPMEVRLVALLKSTVFSPVHDWNAY